MGLVIRNGMPTLGADLPVNEPMQANVTNPVGQTMAERVAASGRPYPGLNAPQPLPPAGRNLLEGMAPSAAASPALAAQASFAASSPAGGGGRNLLSAPAAAPPQQSGGFLSGLFGPSESGMASVERANQLHRGEITSAQASGYPEPPSTELPEAPYGALRNYPSVGNREGWHMQVPAGVAGSDEGQLNIIRTAFPNAQFVPDDMGNPTGAIVFGESSDPERVGQVDPNAVYVRNRPGMSPQDLTSIESAIPGAALPIGASLATGGAGALPALAATAAGGGAGEAITQKLAQGAGSGEQTNLSKIGLAAGAAGLGEGGGRLVGAGVRRLTKGMASNAAPATVEGVETGFEQARAATGGKARTAFEAGESVEGRLGELKGEAERRVSGLYKEADRAAAGSPAVPLKSAMGKLDDPMGAFATSEKRAITRYLKERGFDADTPIGGQDAEQFRQFLNQALKTPDARAKRYVMGVRDALDEATETTAYGSARKAHAELGESFKRQKLVADLLEQRLAPEALFDRVVGKTGKLRNIRQLRETLGEDSPAWKDVRSATVEHLSERAANSSGVTLRRFEGALKTMGDEKLELILGADGKQAMHSLRGLIEEVNATQRNTARLEGKLNQFVRHGALFADLAVSTATGVPLPLLTLLRHVRERAIRRGLTPKQVKPVTSLLERLSRTGAGQGAAQAAQSE